MSAAHAYASDARRHPSEPPKQKKTGKRLTPDTACNILCDIQCMPHGNLPMESGVFDNLRLELRRGCLTLAVLAQLREEYYGYTLRKTLLAGGLEIDESTLYPLLRRLESQGLLVSHWREENKRNKRFYRLSAKGGLILTQLLDEWGDIHASLSRISGVDTPATGPDSIAQG